MLSMVQNCKRCDDDYDYGDDNDDDDHGSFVKPGVIIEEEEVEVDTEWTDLPLLKHGSLTALEIEEQENGVWIQRIRAR